MVSVGSFCIDSTEVTERDYTLFLDAKKGDTSGQIAACSWNTSYNPDPAFFPRKPQLPATGERTANVIAELERLDIAASEGW